MNDALLYNVLGQSSFVLLNKALNRALGANESMIISFMVDKRNFTNGADFYYTIESLCYDTALGEKSVRSAIKNLIEKGILIKKDFAGLPPKQYYNINMNAIMGILSNPSPKGGVIPASIDNPIPKDTFNTPPKDTFNPSPKGGDIYNNKENNNKEIKTHNGAREACAGGGGDFANAPLNATADKSSVVEPTIRDSQIVQPMPKELKRPPSHVSIVKTNEYARLCSQLGVPYDRGQEASFMEFWNLYPRKTNQIKAVDSFLQALGRGVMVEHIIAQLKLFKRLLGYRKTEIDKVPFASTWLDSDRFNDDLESELAQYEKSKNEVIVTPKQVWARAMSELPQPNKDFTHADLSSKPAILRAFRGMKLYAAAKMHTIVDIGLGKGDSLPAGYLIAITLRDESGEESSFKFYALNQLEAFVSEYKI